MTSYTIDEQKQILVQLTALKKIRVHMEKRYYKPLTRSQFNSYIDDAKRSVENTFVRYDE